MLMARNFGIKMECDMNPIKIEYNKSCTTFYFNNNIHVEFCNSARCWYKNGVFHRDNDMPAIIYASGAKIWYKNGEMHRDNDMPAATYADGSKYWYKNGEQYDSSKD